ncbi:MAG: hypothetical protein FWG32_06480 [Oscillospiraceae bacterium]|nr:hypothetical protein [Oscillospiraceae bacterium]
MKERSSKRNSSGVSIGGATIVMIFSVLCLTIFAILSLITAGNDLTLSQKSAAAMSDYYEADSRAVEIMDIIAASYDGSEYHAPDDIEIDIIYDYSEAYLSYSVPVNENLNLSVFISAVGKDMSVIMWELTDSGAWEADERIEVWDGNLF